MTIRDAFKLAVIDGILLEDVAERTFESLPDSRLVAVCLLVIGLRLTCSSFRFVVTGRLGGDADAERRDDRVTLSGGVGGTCGG